jgi:hypothetical protein
MAACFVNVTEIKLVGTQLIYRHEHLESTIEVWA